MAFRPISIYTAPIIPELERTAYQAQSIPTAQKTIAAVNNPLSSVTTLNSQALKRPQEYADVTPAAKRAKIEIVSVDLSVKMATPIRDQGKITYANGNIYEGGLNDGKPHGQGKLIYVNGDIYEGALNNDKLHGQGKITYANGDIYEGALNNGKLHGQGTLTYVNGDI
jgi:hypothetical protein